MPAYATFAPRQPGGLPGLLRCYTAITCCRWTARPISLPPEIHCSSCLEKHHRNGSVSYSHQLLGATLVHPDLKEVMPLAPEPIIQQDGQTKNDCERNATRRWLKRFRQEHPHLPVIVVEDAQRATPPASATCVRLWRAHYIIGVKPGDHAFLFAHLRALEEAGQMQVLPGEDPATGVWHHFQFCNGVPFNESNPDELVKCWNTGRSTPMGRFSISVGSPTFS